MQQVFYIHGGAAFSEYADYLQYLRTREVRDSHGNKPDLWPQTLQSELGAEFEVFTPQMPNSDNAKYEEWKIWFERHFEYLNDGVILVGWSLGALFLQKYLTENALPFILKSLILVAPPVYYFTVEGIGEDGADFNYVNENLLRMTKITKNIFLYHSKDDFIVPYDHALKFLESVPEAKLVTFTDRNHFLQSEFPELIAQIKSLAED